MSQWGGYGYGAPQPPAYNPGPGYGAPPQPPGYNTGPGSQPPGYNPGPSYGAPQPPGYNPEPGYGAPPQPPAYNTGAGSQPPGYNPGPGYGAPPQPPAYNTGAGYQNQTPVPNSRRQTQPAGQQDKNRLQSLFEKVDKDRSGQIDARELQDALSNGTWMPFNPETVRMMIKLFDSQRKGTINFKEFLSLWKYISDWQATFQRFDFNGSGNIDKEELKRSLSSFGYKLSDRMYGQLMERFDRSRTDKLNFDDFIHLCVVLHTLTAAFRDKDQDRRGVIRISYESFLSMVLRSGI